ncbi:hypothetical protein F441_02256 [Phytophthora nicotianae CJ01A1]|uniref:Uncharacterized protein n=1 Tax=Phytophthora nicotianae CJ01A1 TaxID=1317063 RepID=W2XS94_PHYNI|nr:hypothetical protein F441_02256 [Phytophthora nicotianae CJ01A1]
MHRVRRQVVDDVLKFYRQHNGLYEMVTVDCSEVSLEAIAETLIYEDVNADVEVSELDADHNRVGGVSDNDVCRVKSDIVERRVVFISDDHENDNTLFARMFPHLFPEVSTLKFSEDELFMLPSFDYLSVQKMYTQLSLKCQRHPVLFEPYSDIKQDALVKVLSEKELLRQGLTTSTRDDESSATDFLKTVELSGSSIWGSDAERAQCREHLHIR